MDDNERIERIPQAAIGKETNFPDLYEAASAVARRVLKSSQEIAGTTYCKGVQIAELAQWAKGKLTSIKDNLHFVTLFASLLALRESSKSMV